MNLPNLLTLLRILLIPLFVIAYYLPHPWSNIIATTIFSISGITDWFDGYLARMLKQTSAFGAFLDPVADKLSVAVALVLLVSNPNLPYLAIPCAIIISREIVVSALREWMAELGSRASIAVSFIGKAKTLVQIFAIIFLVACNPLHPGFKMYTGYILLYLAAILTLWSMCIYLKAVWPMFRVSK